MLPRQLLADTSFPDGRHVIKVHRVCFWPALLNSLLTGFTWLVQHLPDGLRRDIGLELGIRSQRNLTARYRRADIYHVEHRTYRFRDGALGWC